MTARSDALEAHPRVVETHPGDLEAHSGTVKAHIETIMHLGMLTGKRISRKPAQFWFKNIESEIKDMINGQRLAAFDSKFKVPTFLVIVDMLNVIPLGLLMGKDNIT